MEHDRKENQHYLFYKNNSSPNEKEKKCVWVCVGGGIRRYIYKKIDGEMQEEIETEERQKIYRKKKNGKRKKHTAGKF